MARMLFQRTKSALTITCAMVTALAVAATPADTVKSFGKAIKKNDFVWMAKLVKGGVVKFDYSKLHGFGSDFEERYSEVEVKVIKTSVTKAEAKVKFDFMLNTQNGAGSGTSGVELPLALIDGKWKIVPSGKGIFEGNDFMNYVNVVANPTAALRALEDAYGDGVNKTAESRKLGAGRAATLERIFAASEPREKDGLKVPYSGYDEMVMVQHTNELWPIGRGDTVILHAENGNGQFLTKWHIAKGKAVRDWQVQLAETISVGLANGTLEKWLGSQGFRLPAKASKNAIATVRAVQGYAAYHTILATATFHAWVIRPDGKDARGNPSSTEEVYLDPDQASKTGYFITPAELAMMKKPSR